MLIIVEISIDKTGDVTGYKAICVTTLTFYLHAYPCFLCSVSYCGLLRYERRVTRADPQFKKPYRTCEVFIFSKLILRLSRGLNSWQLKKMNLIFLCLAIINVLYIWILFNLFSRRTYLFLFPVGQTLRWNWDMGKGTQRGCTKMCFSLRYDFQCSEYVTALQCAIAGGPWQHFRWRF